MGLWNEFQNAKGRGFRTDFFGNDEVNHGKAGFLDLPVNGKNRGVLILQIFFRQHQHIRPYPPDYFLQVPCAGGMNKLKSDLPYTRECIADDLQRFVELSISQLALQPTRGEEEQIGNGITQKHTADKRNFQGRMLMPAAILN